jgi:hypothetical protein
VQILENLTNIRVSVIPEIEGHDNVHSEYVLMVNVIVAGEGATFNDRPHYAAGIVPVTKSLPPRVTEQDPEEQRHFC